MGGYGCKKYLAVFVGPAHFIVFIAPVARLRFMTTRGTCHCAAAPPSSREASHFRGVFQVRLLPRDFEKSIRHACHFQVKEFYRDSLRHKTPLSLVIHSDAAPCEFDSDTIATPAGADVAGADAAGAGAGAGAAAGAADGARSGI